MQSPTGQLYCDFCGKGEEDCSHIIVSGPDQQGGSHLLDLHTYVRGCHFPTRGGHPLAASICGKAEFPMG